MSVDLIVKNGWLSPEQLKEKIVELKLGFNDEQSPDHCADCKRIMEHIDAVFGVKKNG